MLDFKLLDIKSVPVNEPSVENLQDECDLEDIITDSFGNLTAVDELDESTESLDVDGDVSTESTMPVDEVANAVPTNGVRKALQKLQKATGLNFDQPQPKPPPSIMIEKGVCRAYLQGMCYLTLAPLVHLLITARPEDQFAIELDAPYLHSSDFISLATAMEHSEGSVTVAVRRIDSMYSFMLMDAADSFHVAPHVHHVGPMSAFSMGSSLDMENTTEAFSSHEEYINKMVLERGFLTEDDLEEISEKGKSVRFTTEDLLARIKS